MPQSPYQDEISAAITTLSNAILKHNGAQLLEDASRADAMVREILREVGRGTVAQIWQSLAEQVVLMEMGEGLKIERQRQISVTTLYGPVRVPSPYLWDRKKKRGCRPVSKHLGLQHHGRTPAVERALTDFGAEESFGQASRRFEEHYGFGVGRTTVLRVVEGHAKRAEHYLEQQLDTARADFEQPPAIRPGVEKMEVQLDGSEIRTGVLHLADGTERTPVRGLPKKTRHEAWRDVRVGLACPPNQVEPTYIARMDTYPKVVNQLFGAACIQGLSSQTSVVGIGDGGYGLKEELESQFVGIRFILDRAHLKGHLFETADACGLKDADKMRWVAQQMAKIDTGQVGKVIALLRLHKGRGKKRVLQLIKHLTRFRNSVHYNDYREAGLPIGSGKVESAHRTIPQKRLKLPGAGTDSAITVDHTRGIRVRSIPVGRRPRGASKCAPKIKLELS